MKDQNRKEIVMLTEDEIIAMRRQAIEKKYSSIFSSATYIGENRYIFAEREIERARIVAHLPREFIEMPLVVAKLKYLSESRPDTIITSTDIFTNFGFSLLSEAVKDEELFEIRNTMLEVLKKLSPQNIYIDGGVKTSKTNHIFAWHDYTTPTLDVDVYMLHAYMRIKDRLLHILFNCAKDEYEFWKPIALEVISSIREDDKL